MEESGMENLSLISFLMVDCFIRNIKVDKLLFQPEVESVGEM